MNEGLSQLNLVDVDSSASNVEKLKSGSTIPDKAKVAVLVAHPDDETLWAGGTLIEREGWEVWVGTLCRGNDPDRAPKFRRVLERLRAKGAMASLDDGSAQSPLEPAMVRKTLGTLLPSGALDLVMTHAPNGEYTRHLRHEEVSRAILQMWACGEIQSTELWLFAYDDENGHRLPSAEEGADVLVELSEDVWAMKRELLTEIYGFIPGSWEVRTTPRREAFWRVVTPTDARAWLERGTRPT